jgi:membrane protease YdiL (CAAX protease family)
MLLTFTLAYFSVVVAHFGVSNFYNTSLDQLPKLDSQNLINAMQFAQAITSIFTFLLSAILFAYLTHPKPLEYLGVRKPSNSVLVYLIIPLMVFVALISSQIGEWLQYLDFGKAAKSAYAEQERFFKTMMQGTSFGHLGLYLFLFALLPAVGEELLFRGVVMRFAYNNGQNIHFAILFSAAIFGLAHGSAYNFLPILFSGVVLGYVYYYSSSILLSILAHFINNALAVVLMFLGNKHIISADISEAKSIPLFLMVFFVLAFWLLFTLISKKATPLAIDWNDDFKGENY